MSRNRHSIFSLTAKVERELTDTLGNALSPQRVTALKHKVADYLARRVSQYILERSRTRHKTADRLGAPYTGVLEFSVGNPAYTRRGGSLRGYVRNGESIVEIKGVAGLARAFRNLIIRPRRARALTIPIDRESYAKSAAQMKDSGWKLFIPRKRRSESRARNVLWGSKGGLTKPLYALCAQTKVKHDPKLLPAPYMIAEWSAKAAAEYMEAVGI